MFDGETGHVRMPKPRGLSAFTAPAASAPSAGLADTLRGQNLKLMAENAEHRWVIDKGGQPKTVTVQERVLGEMDAYGCRKVIGYRPSERARCNGDGTVSVAFWSDRQRAWVFEGVRHAAA